MTTTNSPKPGRELDAIIAEKVMGWEEISWDRPAHKGTAEPKGMRPGERPSQYTGFRPSFVVPAYSTDIAAAWEVVEKLRSNKGYFQLEDGLQKNWRCWYGDADAEAETAPLAICLAALKAVGA